MSRILLIEDDPFLIRVYSALLEKKGYNTSILENGSEAVDRAKIYKPDLILLDLIMPVTDGYETLKNLKGEKHTKDIPVFVLSVIESDEEIEKVKKLGAESFIKKAGATFNQVVDSIEKHLSP